MLRVLHVDPSIELNQGSPKSVGLEREAHVSGIGHLAHRIALEMNPELRRNAPAMNLGDILSEDTILPELKATIAGRQSTN